MADEFELLVRRVQELPAEVAAYEVRSYFDSLAPGDASRLAETRPDEVGSLDGAPAALRYRANHLRLVDARDRLRDAGPLAEHERKRLETLDELLTPVAHAEVDASGKVVEVLRDRQFLSLQPEGQGRAVEVLGELDRARNVAVLVPGMGNSLETLRGQVDRADLIRHEAGPGTAAVLWLDYDSPQGLREAASKRAAIQAGPALRRFMAGLETERLPEASVTLVGHSYGSDVVGQGMLQGVRVDRVVLTGSPGITKFVNQASDFVPPPTRLYVERAPGDYVSYSEWHGPDPATFPDAIRMATNDETVSVHWHNEYYRQNSEALRNIGRVVRGDLAHITTTDTTRAHESKLALGISWADPLNNAAAVASKVYDGVVSLTKRNHTSAAGVATDGSRPSPVVRGTAVPGAGRRSEGQGR
ncbi:alpha/beta hydrolase [Kribbella monticola]|uniref:alpha/beta hydrolase n=1 Tax=Kribbella monticola TaxID=2185285 RepID=UPI000DD3E6B7|nr:alpha/beta hydrolase [Kribbella monticola]